MDKELLAALGTLLDEKLEPIKTDINYMKTDIDSLKADMADMKSDINGMKTDINNLKTDMVDMKSDISGMKTDINNLKADMVDMKSDIKSDIKHLKTQQEENYQILKSLEHKADINKAEHDKFTNELANLSGEITNMRKDLSTVEIVTARNMENIANLKIIK